MRRAWFGLGIVMAMARPALGAPNVKMTEPLAVESPVSMAAVAGKDVELAQAPDGMLLLFNERLLRGIGDGAVEGEGGVFAQLLSSDGETVGVPLELGPGQALGATFDGTSYVVAYANTRGVYPDGDILQALVVRRISTSGELIGEAVDLEGQTTRQGQKWDLAIAGGTGETVLVSCTDVCRVKVLVGDAWSSSPHLPYIDRDAQLAHSNGVWLLAGKDDDVNESYLVQLDEQGRILPSTGSFLPYRSVRVTPWPTGFVAAWSHNLEPDYYDEVVEVATIGFDGVVGTPTEVQSVFADARDLYLHGVQSTPGGLLVFTTDVGDYSCVHSDPKCFFGQPGQMEASKLDEALTLQGVADLSWSDSTGVASAPGHVVLADAIMLRHRVNGALDLSEPVVVAEKPARAYAPLGAQGPEGWLVAWNEDSPSLDQPFRSGVRAAVLSSDGTTTAGPTLLREHEYLRALSAGPGGWLMAVTTPAAIAGDTRLLLLPHENPLGGASEEPEVEWSGHVKLAGSPSGWLMLTGSLRGYRNQELTMRRRSAAGVWEEPTILTTFPNSGDGLQFTGVMDATFDGERYVVTWLEGHRVLSVRIPVEGELGDLQVDTLLWPTEGVRLEAAFGPQGWWLLATQDEWSTWVADGSVSYDGDHRIGSLSIVDGYLLGAKSALTNDGGFSIVAADPGETPIVAATGEDLLELSVSEPSGNRALLTGLTPTPTWGEERAQVGTRILQLGASVGEGGAGGAGAGGEAGDNGRGGAVDSGGGAGAGDAGDGGAGDKDAGDRSGDDGCGCRMSDASTSSAGSTLLLTGLGIAASLARRRRRAVAAGRDVA